MHGVHAKEDTDKEDNEVEVMVVSAGTGALCAGVVMVETISPASAAAMIPFRQCALTYPG